MGRKVYVVGVGMIKFEKPGKRDWDYPKMGQVAALKALRDSQLPFSAVQQAVVGYVYGDSTCGQRAVYEVGLTGIPVYNVNNNCSTGSTALYMGKQLVEGGLADCVLALGFEKMERGSLGAKFTDRTNPLDKHFTTMAKTRQVTKAPFAPQMFGNAGREHMEKYGTTVEHFAKIAQKNHKHSVNNPYSQFRDEYTLEDVLKSRKVHEPLTMLQCCPTSDGAAAAILCSEEVVRKYNLEPQAVEIIGMSMATDLPSSFEESCIKMVGSDMTKKASSEVYNQSGLSPNDVQVIELHDCFSCNELVTYEGLGLCREGEAGKLVDEGNVTYGGKWVVNPSGGLISKGHPLGATGLAQCAELCWQLRGMCGKRQVPNAKVALQHNLGLGGAAVVAMYRLGFPSAWKPWPQDKPNPAIDENTDEVDPRAPSSSSSSSIASSPSFKAAAVFEELAKKVASDASLVSKVGAIYCFVVKGDQGQTRSWTVDLKNGAGSVREGDGAKADCTVSLSDSDFADLFAGKLDPQSAFMTGKLKVQGNMALAMKLNHLFGEKKKAAL
ncbi:sterol carrier protein 2 [Balamuthia mandrillaris]